MSALMHGLSLLLAVFVAFVWLHIPVLSQYSLQVFALSIVLYLLIKRFKQSSIWHLAPGTMSIELALLTFAILLVVGFTGDTRSLLFSLSYVHLFFVVFAAEASTAIITTMAVVLFYYALSPSSNPQDLANLATLPLMLFFFIFAKAQYQQANRQEAQLKTDHETLTVTAHGSRQLKSFLLDFLKPKLEYLTSLLSHPQQNKQAIEGQLTLLQVEIEKIVLRIGEPPKIEESDPIPPEKS